MTLKNNVNFSSNYKNHPTFILMKEAGLLEDHRTRQLWLSDDWKVMMDIVWRWKQKNIEKYKELIPFWAVSMTLKDGKLTDILAYEVSLVIWDFNLPE